MLEIIQKLGKDLTKEELDVINNWRVKEFNSKPLWGPTSLKAFGDSEVFMLKKEDSPQILAFARLRPIEIWVGAKSYPIWGLGAVVAISKGQGFGRTLISNIQNFSVENSMPIVGFCNDEVINFYKKCGFSIMQNGTDSFVYIDHNDKENKSKEIQNAIYYPVDNQILKLLKETPGLTFRHYVPHW